MKILPRLLVAAVLAGCNQAAEKVAVPPPRVDKNAVIFEPASPQLGSIHTAGAEPQREAVLRFNGRLVWDEERTARVFTPLAGKVMSIAVRAGDAVKAGQMLAVLSAPEFGSAQAEARKAEQDFLLAQKNRARIEELQAAGVAPRRRAAGRHLRDLRPVAPVVRARRVGQGPWHGAPRDRSQPLHRRLGR